MRGSATLWSASPSGPSRRFGRGPMRRLGRRRCSSGGRIGAATRSQRSSCERTCEPRSRFRPRRATTTWPDLDLTGGGEPVDEAARACLWARAARRVLRAARAAALRRAARGARPGIAVALVARGRASLRAESAVVAGGPTVRRVELGQAAALVQELRARSAPDRTSAWTDDLATRSAGCRDRGARDMGHHERSSSCRPRAAGVRIATPSGEVEVTVDDRARPTVPASCGAVPEAVERYVVTRIAQ